MAINYQDCWTYPKEKIDQLIGKAIQYKTGTITGETGVTLSEKRAVQRGTVVEVHFVATLSSAVGSSEKKLVTITGVDLPPENIRTLAGSGAHGYDAVHPAYAILDNAGVMKVLASTTTDTVINFDIVYCVD